KAMKDFTVQIPPLNEQKAIANILSTLDEKIETNNKINEKLEEMAQALFKRWFVDFEFPNENGEPYKSSGGEMVESELGMIPKGWEIKTLGNYVNIKSGFAFKSSWWKREGVPVIKIKNIANKTISFNDVGYVDEDKVEQAKLFKVTSGDLLIALTGATIGKIGLVYSFGNTILVNQRVGKFFLGDDPFKKLPFLYTLLNNKSVNDKLISLGMGSAQPNVSPKQIESIKVPMSEIVVDKFNSILNSFFKQIVNNLKENEKLSIIRDTLLPKLMSGEIRVPLDDEVLSEKIKE
uniref:restriction endonuclease subunit S n=1 Tax=Piscibacillus halophilus TaxID=571933 RepID=UPI00158B046F